MKLFAHILTATLPVKKSDELFIQQFKLLLKAVLFVFLDFCSINVYHNLYLPTLSQTLCFFIIFCIFLWCCISGKIFVLQLPVDHTELNFAELFHCMHLCWFMDLNKIAAAFNVMVRVDLYAYTCR